MIEECLMSTGLGLIHNPYEKFAYPERKYKYKVTSNFHAFVSESLVFLVKIYPTGNNERNRTNTNNVRHLAL